MRLDRSSRPLVVLLTTSAFAVQAQLAVVPDHQPQCIFAGDTRSIAVTFRNVGGKIFEADVTARMHQTSSATTVRVGDSSWKKLQVLPGQTILESAQLAFPAVKAETRFLIQWLENTNRVLGTTIVLVYPEDLLKELKPGASEESLGVFDPQNQIRPLLRKATVEFTDMEDAGVESFSGKLAIVGPFEAKARMREGLAKQIEALAAKGVSVVWIQPPPERRDKLQPSFYTVTIGQGTVVIVQAELIADLAERPQSQLKLIHFGRLAQLPEPARLPH